MSDEALIEQIVSHVMERIRAGEAAARGDNRSTAAATPAPAKVAAGTILQDAVITAEVLAKQVGGAKQIQFSTKAILTPSAHDYLRTHKIEWSRGATAGGTSSANGSKNSIVRWRAIVVQATPSIEAAFTDAKRSSQVNWDKHLSGCWREATDAAVGAICRAEIDGAILLCRDVAVAACRANRNTRIRAAAARTIADVRAIQNSMGANVYCVDPADKSMFELRNLMRAIAAVVPRVPENWKE